jgi:VacB/RNase II family 3'-5' exoribonuclease
MLRPPVFDSPLFDPDAKAVFDAGFTELRQMFQLTERFADDVEAEARLVASSNYREAVLEQPDRIDATNLAFVTLDPASSTDLDQAFAIEQLVGTTNLRLHYAIADVGAFVARGSALEAAAWQRGQTMYLPDGRVPQYPESICEDAASLLPNGPRPAIVLAVDVDTAGDATLHSIQRAVIRSRAKLAYETTELSDVELLDEFSKRIFAAEIARGTARIELPEQEVHQNIDGSFSLQFRTLRDSEVANSAMSLAANLAVAKRLIELRTGVFRVMPAPDAFALQSLRQRGKALGVQWPRGTSLSDLQRTLDPTNAQHRAFLVAARRSGGGALYATFATGQPSDASEAAGTLVNAKPFHSAIGAPYAHVTAPLRRLADRYVLDELVAAERSTTATDEATFVQLAAVMERTDSTASQIERASLDLVEAVLLRSRIGETFEAVVLDAGKEGASIQLLEPAVAARLPRSATRAGAVAGATVSVRLDAVDVTKRQIRFVLA